MLGLAAVLLIPVSRIYLARHAAAAGSRESAAAFLSPALGAATKVASASAALPKETWHEVAARAGVDASNFYKDAFVLYDKFTEEEQMMFRKPPDELDLDKAAELFKRIQPILELLRQGAEADYCEWGLGPLTIDSNLSHLSRAMGVGRLAAWSASYRFPSDPQNALIDLKSQLRLGGHVADSDLGWLVQMSLERRANEVLSQNAGALDAAGLLQAQELVRASTVEKNMATALAAEAGLFTSTAKIIAAQTPSERGDYLLKFLGGRPATEALRQMFQDEAALTAELRYFQQMKMEMNEGMSWPEAQFQAWWKGVENSLPNHPLAEAMNLTNPGNVEIYQRHQQAQVERAMLSAGLTLLQNGSAQLAQFRDPVSGAAFSYVEKADGFELQSTLKKNGKPVTMSFTRR